ncbi:hypothetical protein NE579_16890, partial [Intestinimonas massiliensis]|nr:hypothetical protein [Intestinimonas massiliensis (ex Afouda et al. 2020)]
MGSVDAYTEQSLCGTIGYNGSTKTLEEYMETVASMGNEDLEMFEQVKQPAYINHNAYLKNAPAFDAEKENYTSAADPQVKIS